MDSSLARPTTAVKKIMHPDWEFMNQEEEVGEFVIANSEPIDATGD